MGDQAAADGPRWHHLQDAAGGRPPAAREPTAGRLIQPQFQLAPLGPFNLGEESEFFGGWPPLHADPSAVAMAFPVEGWRTSAAVVVRQTPAAITGEVHGATGADARAAWNQALAVLSLDVDGSGSRRLVAVTR